MKKTLQKISLGIICFLGISYQTFAQQPIADFKFNSSRTSETGGLTFSAANTSFVQGRDGSPNGAISMVNQSTSATIPNLPVGSSARTVSIWVKLNSFNPDDYNQFFSYGSTVGGSTSKWYAGGMNEANVMAIGYANNKFFPTTNTLNTWNHFVFVYNGTSSTMYKNGVSLGTEAHALNTNASTTFNLGLGVSGEKGFNGAIDDLKIYNTALDQTQVTNLYTINSADTPRPIINSMNAVILDQATAQIQYNLDLNGYNLTRIDYQVSDASTFTSGVVTTTVTTGLPTTSGNYSFDFKRLTNNKLYYYRLTFVGNFTTYYTPNSNNFTVVSSVLPTLILPKITSVSSELVSPTAVKVSYTCNTLNTAYKQANAQFSTTQNFATIAAQQTGFEYNYSGATLAEGIVVKNLTKGSSYFYRVIARGADGNDTSAVKSITLPLTNPSPVTIAEFDFNNSYLDKTGQLTFSNPSGVTFTEDRNTNPSKAVHLPRTPIAATIPNLPSGGFDRTISYWVKMDSLITDDGTSIVLFEYGGANYKDYLKQEIYKFQNKIYLRTSADYITGTSIELKNLIETNWNHIVLSYGSDTLKTYLNGVMIQSTAFLINTFTNSSSQFKLGGSADYPLSSLTKGSFDDLKIYNYALNLTEITQLYRNNIVTGIENSSSTDFAIYPNPAKDIVNVSGFSEILSLSGNKVAEGTETIDVSGLASGVYIVKTGANTSKLIKE